MYFEVKYSECSIGTSQGAWYYSFKEKTIFSRLDTYRVRIVESSLANSNELSGAYFVSVTSSRMSLLSITDLNELLSWPINHVTYYTHQPVTHQIFLIMSRLVNSTSSLCLIICLNINKTYLWLSNIVYICQQ